jgi:hypothetical protein
LLECPNVILGQLHNSAASRQDPAIAFNAADQSLAVVVDLDKQVLAVEACDLSHEDSLLVRPTPDKAFPFQLCPSALLDGEKLV